MMSSFYNMERGRCRQLWSRVWIPICLAVAASAPLAWAQSKSKESSAVRVDDKGRKFVNKIPYDVFFDNPLQVVNSNKNTAPAVETAEPTKPDTKAIPAAPDAPATASSGKAGAIAWQEILPAQELLSEVKTLRNSLNSSMANPGKYGQNFQMIAIEGAELAALARIAQEHSENVSWKDKAQYVRDFSAQLNQFAVGLGKDNFDKTKTAFQKLTSTLDGSIPADAGDIPEMRPFNEIATRKSLMKRMEKAKEWLKKDVNSEAKFKSMSDQIQHESSILAALTTVVTTDGYEYVENDDYQQYAKSLIDGAKSAMSASKEDSYESFKQAVDKMNKSCTDCHGDYGSK